LVDKASRQIYRICPKYHRQMVPTGCMFGKMVSTLVFDWRSGNQFQLLFPAPAFYLGFPLQGSRFCGKLFGVNYFLALHEQFPNALAIFTCCQRNIVQYCEMEKIAEQFISQPRTKHHLSDHRFNEVFVGYCQNIGLRQF